MLAVDLDTFKREYAYEWDLRSEYNHSHENFDLYVQVLKNGLKMVKDEAIDSRIARALFAYQRLSPEELLWGRSLIPQIGSSQAETQ